MVEKKSTAEKKPASGVNKSAEIRKIAASMKEKNEKPRPVAIIAALKKQGVVVSSPQVSMVLKRMGFRPRKRRASGGVKNHGNHGNVGPIVTGRRPKAATGQISIEDLITAKKVVAQLGGTDRALAAIAALKRFES